MNQLRVLICGGGIAGNALAFWLSNHGHDVTVIERFPSLRDTGLQIDLRGHGIEVMKRMGLEQVFRSKAVKEEGTRFIDSSGRQRAYFPCNTSGEGLQSFTTDFEIMRGDLCRLLYEATGDRVKYIFGTTIEHFEENNCSIDVLFSDGKKDRFDLLVGADGQGSRTRRMMIGPGVTDPFKPLGVYAAYFTIPQQVQEGEKYCGTFYFAPGKRVVFTRRHQPSTIQTYLLCKTDSERMKNCRKGDLQAEKEAMTEIFRGAGWQTDRILKCLEDADDFYCERLGLVKLDSWSSGRVVLLGDAAYCPSATTGMGTTCGLVGAYILAGEILENCGSRTQNASAKVSKDGIAVALKVYDQKFRPFMDEVQKGISAESSAWDWLPSTAFWVSVVNFIMAVTSYFRLEVLTRYVLRENTGSWTLPDYKDMVQGLRNE